MTCNTARDNVLEAIQSTFNQIGMKCSIEATEDKIPENIFFANIEEMVSNLMTICKRHKEIRNNPTLVQITASTQQINERISSFMNHAQNQIDEQNQREFRLVNRESSPGSARTDACYKRRADDVSHVHVSRAENKEGPQLQMTSQGTWIPSDDKTNVQASRNVPENSIDERLMNLETHLVIKKGQRVPKDVYGRIKALENRILELESSSPEYNIGGLLSSLKTEMKNKEEERSLEEIDSRIRTLKQKLKSSKRMKCS